MYHKKIINLTSDEQPRQNLYRILLKKSAEAKGQTDNDLKNKERTYNGKNIDKEETNNTNDTDNKSLDKRETIMLLMTKSLTMNNFKKTTATDKKLIKQWRNATTQGYYLIPVIYIFIFKNLQWQKISTKKKYL